MTTTPERTATLTTLVAAEIRAWMGRLDVRQSELARRMGETDQWLSMRLKGRTPIDLNELQRMCSALGVNAVDVLQQALRDSSETDRPIEVPASPARRSSHVATRPMAPSRRDATRPSSPVPPNRRRPSPVRPGDRAMAA